jgi:drug/metabolite transporter (DMT)-like permease
MRTLADNPVFLLLVVGALIGISFPVGKLADQSGVDPVLWSLVISGGSGLVLLLALLARGYRTRFDMHFVRYCFVSGLLSYVLPNIVMFSAIPRLGAGFVGLMFTLSPVITLAISMAAGIRVPSRLGITGVAIGFVGAMILTSTRGAVSTPDSLAWTLAAFAIPVLLATGNIYRTIDWPQGRAPLELSTFSNLAAGLVLIAVLLALQGTLPLGGILDAPGLTVAQIAMSSLVFALFFRLQLAGGPVYLSQIGYVAAAVGLVSGIAFLGERYALATWIGAAIIAAGIALTIRAQLRVSRTPEQTTAKLP